MAVDIRKYFGRYANDRSDGELASIEEAIQFVCDSTGLEYSEKNYDLMLLATMPFVLQHLVKFLDSDIEDIKKDLSRIKRRKKFLPEDVSLFIKICELYFNGMCPICRKTKVCEDGKLVNAEVDHWHANHAIGPRNGWVICKPCHKSIDFHDIEQREKVEPHYKSFLAFVNAELMRQPDLFPVS